MNKPLILVVEDDLAVARLISTTLETRNYQYHRVQNGAGALLEAASARPDVILLDLGLPDMDGIDVIRKIRGWSNVPILVVSARSDDADKVSALDAGADDYLTKPFSTGELLARIRALTRRTGDVIPDCYQFHDLKLNMRSYALSTDSNSIKLSLKEYQIMEMLIANPRQIIPKERIIEKIWGFEKDVEYNNIEVYISFLRKKLSAISSAVQIKTARSIGYSLEAPQ